jgi:hypothetical protein
VITTYISPIGYAVFLGKVRANRVYFFYIWIVFNQAIVIQDELTAKGGEINKDDQQDDDCTGPPELV